MSVLVMDSTHADNTTDLHLLVGNYEQYSEWDPRRIKDNLMLELHLDPDTAGDVADRVSSAIGKLDKQVISTTLIREVVNLELIERGIASTPTTIDLPKQEISLLLAAPSAENSNQTSYNPESVSFTLSEIVMKRMALETFFGAASSPTSAHLSGAIHIHDLGMFHRVYCSVHSVDYIKKYGLNLPDLDVISGPANHLRTLIGHINTYLSIMQAYYAGAMGLSYVNIAFAPYSIGMSYEELKQDMQYLMFSLAQCAYSRGAQVLFSDFNIHPSVPEWMKPLPAIGPGGVEMEQTYGEFERESRRVAKAILEVAKEGDYTGAPFAFPKIDFHVDQTIYSDPEAEEVYDAACEVASKHGGIYFVMDYSDVTLAACCRLRTTLDEDLMNDPASIRFCGLQNVTINLPQIGYRNTNATLEELVNETRAIMDIALEAHMIKRKWVKKFMEPGQCLSGIGRVGPDGKPYVELDRATHIIGLIGLDSLFYHLRGQHLHESNSVLLESLQYVAELQKICQEYTNRTGLKFVLEESPAESASRRLAKIDLHTFKEAEKCVLGNMETEDVYYPNSIHLLPDADVSLLRRIRVQSMYHPFIEAGAIIHAFVGEQLPPAASIKRLVQNTHKAGQCAQLTISPEFTVCKDCSCMNLGLHQSCQSCGSSNILHRSRIVGYFSNIERWNPSKIEELKARHIGEYSVEE